ncbi:MAG: hypothetical protein JW894_02060 [Bacteroidales bacterium]|nr:hypothetical protein [Bacteroidales bacterium]
MLSRKPALLVSLAVLFSISVLHARTPKSHLLFSITSDSKARLGVINAEDKSMSLEVNSMAGETLFSKVISKNDDFFQMLDLSAMPDGEYKVVLTGADQNFEKRFTVTNHVARLKKVIKNCEPFFHVINNEVLAVSYLNPEYSKVNVFFELNDDVLYEDRAISGSPISRKYSLKQLPKGEYTVKLYSDGKIFSYPLAIK